MNLEVFRVQTLQLRSRQVELATRTTNPNIEVGFIKALALTISCNRQLHLEQVWPEQTCVIDVQQKTNSAIVNIVTYLT